MGSFVQDAEGVWFETPGKKEGEQPNRTWVCSPLDILAITRDHDNENHGKLLRYYDYEIGVNSFP
jgi:putative DNA primase/helicase